MALKTKKEFAALVNQSTRWLSVYIERGKVVVNKKGMIDTENVVNKSFLLQYDPTKKTEPQIPREETFKDPTATSERPAELGDIPDVYVSDARYKHFLALKTERAAELDRLKIDKIKGEVIPSDLMPPVILQHNQSFVTAFKNVADQILTDFAKIKNFSVAEIADMRGRMLQAINDGAKNATAMSLKTVSVIVKDFSVKRGVGERA